MAAADVRLIHPGRIRVAFRAALYLEWRRRTAWQSVFFQCVPDASVSRPAGAVPSWMVVADFTMLEALKQHLS